MKMNNRILMRVLVVAGLFLIFTNSCKKLQYESKKTVTDIDGNVYNTVTIGSQVWMAENLKVTKYRNGDVIGLRQSAYNDNESNVATYGRLYEWNAVNDSRGISPAGWHVPSDAEWTVLINYLGGDAVAGGKLKESGTAHWQTPNSGATNETGYTALPGGQSDYLRTYGNMGSYGNWWSSTEVIPDVIIMQNYAWRRGLSYSNNGVSRVENKWGNSLSVRCVKD